jgi:hypothetical protein
MLKKLILTLGILLLCVTVSSGGTVEKLKSVIARKNAAVGGCGSQTARADCQTTDYRVAVSSLNQIGQSFQVSTGGVLYSVKLYLYGNNLEPAESGTLTIRVDDDIDLSADYLDSGSITMDDTDAVDTWYEIVMDGGDQTLSTSTTYYFAVDWTEAGSDSMQWEWHDNNETCHADGVSYSTGATDWDLTGHSEAADLNFQVMICD